MNPCKCCGLSERAGVFIVAVITLFNSAITGGILGSHYYNDKREMTDNQFYLMGGHQIIIAVASIMLFAGAYYKKYYLCLPWIAFTIIGIFIYIIALVSISLAIFIHPASSIVATFVVMLLMVAFFIYTLWIVIRFVDLLIRNRGSDYIPISDANHSGVYADFTRRGFLFTDHD